MCTDQNNNVEPQPDRSTWALLTALPTAPSRVCEVMTDKIVTLFPHDTFQEAVTLMANRPFRHFPVVEEDGKLVGVVSDRDLLRALARAPDWLKTTVADVMNKAEMKTVQPESPLSVAVVEMMKHRINCLPVVDGEGKACGIVTTTDVLRMYQPIQAFFERVLAEGLE